MWRFWFFFGIFLLLTAWNQANAIEPQDIVATQVLEEAEYIEAEGIDFKAMTESAISGGFSFSLSQCFTWLSSVFFKEIQENLTLILKIITLAVLSGVICQMNHDASGGVSEIGFLACFALIASLGVSVVTNLLTVAAETIDTLLCFIGSLLPVMGGLTASAKPGGFSAFYPTLFVSMQFFITLCQKVFLPLILVATGLSFVNALGNRFQISGLLDLMKRCIKWGLGLLLTVFVGILSVHSFSVFAANSLAGRTMKYALCNFVPLVGNVLSESVGAVVSSLRLLNGALGIAGAVTLVFLCALPLLKIFTVSLLFRFSAGCLEPATDKRVVTFLSGMADNITLIFSILLMVAVMFIISMALLCGLML